TEFQSCGVLANGPQGCLVFQPEIEPGMSYFLDNPGSFQAGAHVFVQGTIDPVSTICPPVTGPGIEVVQILRCISICGQIFPSSSSCLGFFADDNDFASALQTSGNSHIGARAFVHARLNFQSTVCSTRPRPTVEDNAIGECFEGCGPIIEVEGCTLFQD